MNGGLHALTTLVDDGLLMVSVCVSVCLSSDAERDNLRSNFLPFVPSK
jgi:hypothetical protein